MKVLRGLLVLIVVLSGCGSDSKTNGTGQTASNVDTYINQCTYHKKATNTDTGSTKDFTGYVHSVYGLIAINEASHTYQLKSYETDVTGKRLPESKMNYFVGEKKTRKVGENETEATDTFYEADRNFSKTGQESKSVDVWRKDSDRQTTLISHARNGELQKLDIVKTTTTVDEATWIHAYAYPNPAQMSSGNQRVLEYSETCVETYLSGRVD